MRPGLARFRKWIAKAGKRSKQIGAIGVVSRVGCSQLWMLEWEIVPLHSQHELEAFANGPCLRHPKLHPIVHRSCKGVSPDRSDRKCRRVGEGAELEVGVLGLRR